MATVVHGNTTAVKMAWPSAKTASQNFSIGPGCKQPGWRIEQRYSSGVLIGNWSEDRHKFKKGEEFANSTHRESFRPYSAKSHAPDSTTRWKGVIRNQGLAPGLLFTHHGSRYMHNTISMYDQTFNRQHTMGPRTWDTKRLAWLPEASDHPLFGEGTKYGLKEQLEEKWKKQMELESIGEFNSTAKLSYRQPPDDSQEKFRKAPRRDISCRTHPQSINKDLHLRSMHQTLFKEIVNTKT